MELVLPTPMMFCDVRGHQIEETSFWEGEWAVLMDCVSPLFEKTKQAAENSKQTGSQSLLWPVRLTPARYSFWCISWPVGVSLGPSGAINQQLRLAGNGDLPPKKHA